MAAVVDQRHGGAAPPTSTSARSLMAGKTGTAQSHGYTGGAGAHGAQGAWADARPRLVHRLRAD